MNSKTAVFNVRVDVRDIALLHRHYSAKGLQISSVSTLTRSAISLLAHSLESQLGAVKFDTISDAVNYLESTGLMGPLRMRGQNALIKGMQSESLQLDGVDTSYLDRKSSISSDQIQKAREILNARQSDSGPILGPLPGTIKED